MLGMALASRLAEAGHIVHLVEGESGPGGLASAESIGPYTWDRFYHVILMSDRHLLGWLEKLGLREELRWGKTRTGFWVDEQLVSLSSTLDYLRFPALTLLDKIRLAITILYAARIRHPERLEHITALDWLRRWSGPRVVNRLWHPLLESKLGPMARTASAAFIWAIIARLYAARRSGLKREQFGYVRGGYATILKRMRQHIIDQGVRLQTNAPVREVRDTGTGAVLILKDGSSAEYDRVVLTVPCPVIGELCPQLSAAEHDRLARVTYQGVICPSLLLRRPLAGYYVTNLTDPSLPFTGVIEMTALVDRSTFGGHTLVYLPRYVAPDDPLWGQSDDAVVARFVDGLRRLYPDLDNEDIVASRVGRVRYVMAVPTLEYSAKCKPPVHTSLDHVSIVNSAQITYGTLNVNETLALVEETLAELLQRFQAPAAPLVTPAHR